MFVSKTLWDMNVVFEAYIPKLLFSRNIKLEMVPIAVFKHENYNISSDIRLEAEVAYIQGQPIVKTKTVVLYYRGSIFKANTYGNSFSDLLIKRITRPQYTVELINYLSRIINHNNLFEVYDKNRNIERYTLEELTFANSENGEQWRAPLFDKSEYSEGLLDAYNRFQQEPLLATINARFSYIFPSIESLNYVPIYGYISSSSVLSRMSEPILHLAVIFNVLAHQDKFSGINNQEAIASFNSIMKAKRLNLTMKSLNEHEYSDEIERLKLELQREHERANGLEIANKTLEEKVEDLNIQLNEQTRLLNQAQTERHQMLEDIDTLHNMLFGVKSIAEDTNRTLHHREEDVKRIDKAAAFVAHEMKKQTIAQTRVESNTDILVLYRSELKPASDDVRAQASESQIWLGTYNGDIENYKPSKLPSDYDEVYYIASNRLNSFKYLLSHAEIAPFIIRVYQRSILIEEEQLEDFVHKVDEVLNSNRKFKSVISLERARADIEAKKREMKELRKQREMKAKIIDKYAPVHLIRNSFKRLVYCYVINDNGKEILTPLANVDKEFAIKAKWFYRYGIGGKYIQELSISAIDSSKFSSHSDARIRYED